MRAIESQGHLFDSGQFRRVTKIYNSDFQCLLLNILFPYIVDCINMPCPTRQNSRVYFGYGESIFLPSFELYDLRFKVQELACYFSLLFDVGRENVVLPREGVLHWAAGFHTENKYTPHFSNGFISNKSGTEVVIQG